MSHITQTCYQELVLTNSSVIHLHQTLRIKQQREHAQNQEASLVNLIQSDNKITFSKPSFTHTANSTVHSKEPQDTVYFWQQWVG